MWLGHFNKRINSTKRPLERRYTGWETFDNMMLKGSSNIMQPTFVLNTTDVDLTSNYAVVEWANLKTNTQFLRYYFVADIVISTGNICTVSLSEDYCGSWKDEIYNLQDSYIVRTNAKSDTTEYFDRHLLDTMSTHNDQVWTRKTTLLYNSTNPRMYANNYNEGCVVFITAGSNNGDVSFGTTGSIYACNPICFARLMKNCNSKDDLPTAGVESSITVEEGLIGTLFPNGISADTASLATAYFQPADYILNAFWLPIPVVPSDSAGNYNKPVLIGQKVDVLNVGGTRWAHGANMANGKIYTVTGHSVVWDYVIRKPDDASDYGILKTVTMQDGGINKQYEATSIHSWNYNKWTDRSGAWSQYQMYLPALGMIDLPAEYCGQTIRFNHRLDVMTGQVDIKMILADETVIGWQRGNLGVPMQITSLTNDYSSYLNAFSANANTTIAQAGASYTLGSIAQDTATKLGELLTGKDTGVDYSANAKEIASNNLPTVKNVTGNSGSPVRKATLAEAKAQLGWSD